eukprot:96865-Amphidinium_carterae.1
MADHWRCQLEKSLGKVVLRSRVNVCIDSAGAMFANVTVKMSSARQTSTKCRGVCRSSTILLVGTHVLLAFNPAYAPSRRIYKHLAGARDIGLSLLSIVMGASRSIKQLLHTH